MPTIKIVNTPWGERTALNMTRVVASAAGDFVVPAAQFFRLGMVNMGIQIQANGCSVTPSFTLAPPEAASDPDQLTTVPWMELATVDSGDMRLYGLATTAIKLRFSGPGEVAITSW